MQPPEEVAAGLAVPSACLLQPMLHAKDTEPEAVPVR